MNIREIFLSVWQWVMMPFYARSWQDVGNKFLSSMPLEEGIRLSSGQIKALGKRVSKLPSDFFREWTENQVKALSTSQICALSPEQVQSLATNACFKVECAKRLLNSFAKNGEHYKLGEVLQAVPQNFWKHQTFEQVVSAIRNLKGEDARHFLKVAAKAATPEQFSCILSELGRTKLIELFLEDRTYEMQDGLATKIEKNSFDVNIKLQNIDRNIDALENWRAISVLAITPEISHLFEKNGNSTERVWQFLGSRLIEMEKSLKKIINIPKELEPQLKESLFYSSTDPKKAVMKWNATLDSWHQTLEEKREKLRQQLLTPQHFFDYWSEEYIPMNYSNAPLSKNMIANLFEKVEKDQKFLKEISSSLLDRVRLEAGCGEFSVCFFDRLIGHKLEEPTDHFLDIDEIEEIVALPGMVEVLDLYTIRHQIDTISREIKNKINNRLCA